MKKLYKIIFILVHTFPLVVKGQNVVDNDLNKDSYISTRLHIDKILRNSMNTDIIKDSIAYYPYLIKLSLVRGLDKKVKVEEIMVNDSTVFKIFPDYEKLKDVNFDNILIHSDKLEYRIPILIVCEKASKAQNLLYNDYFAVIDMHSSSSVMGRIFNLFYTGNPNNSKMIFQQPLFSTTLYRIR